MCSTKKARAKLGTPTTATVPINHILEIGPHSALQGPIREVSAADGNKVAYASVLKRKTSAITSSLSATGWLHCSGFNVNLSEINSHNAVATPSLLTVLPAYPFNHEISH